MRRTEIAFRTYNIAFHLCIPLVSPFPAFAVALLRFVVLLLSECLRGGTFAREKTLPFRSECTRETQGTSRLAGPRRPGYEASNHTSFYMRSKMNRKAESRIPAKFQRTLAGCEVSIGYHSMSNGKWTLMLELRSCSMITRTSLDVQQSH